MYTSTSHHVRKLAKWMELIFSELNFLKIFKKHIKGLLSGFYNSKICQWERGNRVKMRKSCERDSIKKCISIFLY